MGKQSKEKALVVNRGLCRIAINERTRGNFSIGGKKAKCCLAANDPTRRIPSRERGNRSRFASGGSLAARKLYLKIEAGAALGLAREGLDAATKPVDEVPHEG